MQVYTVYGIHLVYHFAYNLLMPLYQSPALRFAWRGMSAKMP